MTDALEQLAARVEAGETDRYLDADIALQVGWSVHAGDNWIGPYGEIAVPEWTTDLRAVSALQKRLLPEWYLMLDGSLKGRVEACLTDGSVQTKEVCEDVNRFFGHAPTETAARLAAILRAMAAHHGESP